MLQISTGIFFEEEKKRRHDETFVFYSNIQIPFELEIVSPLIKVKPVESGDINCYVVDFQLITEEHPMIIKCGEQDFIAQFVLVWAFYFDCVAKTQKEIVQKICREKKSSTHDQQVSSGIFPKTVKLGRRLEKNEIDDFIFFIERFVKVDRSTFKSVIATLKIIDDAKETILTNFDSAYSTLVYALESLSQKHDQFHPEWQDYDSDVRQKLEPILDSIEQEKSESIKNHLVKGKQFRLKKRVESFVEKNLNDNFYRTYLGESTSTLRKSYLNRCLSNLYQFRSSFVHELKTVEQLSSPYAPANDYLMIFGEPYLSYSGLNRLFREVVLNFTEECVPDEYETIEWPSETSSIRTVELAPQHWIFNPDVFHENNVNKWFAEYIQMLNSTTVIDQSRIMIKIEEIFDNAKKENKQALLHYYWLYNAIHNRESDEWQNFLEKRKQFLGECFHFYVVILYLFYNLTYRTTEGQEKIDLVAFDKSYAKYNKERFYKGGLTLSGFTDAGLLAAAANIALVEDNIEKFEYYLNQALSEIANNRAKFLLIETSLKNREEVNLKVYFDIV